MVFSSARAFSTSFASVFVTPLIDDSIDNFIELNESGVPCLLIDSEWNRNFETPLRIFTLQYEEMHCDLRFLQGNPVFPSGVRNHGPGHWKSPSPGHRPRYSGG